VGQAGRSAASALHQLSETAKKTLKCFMYKMYESVGYTYSAAKKADGILGSIRRSAAVDGGW